jgi:hypothetical protein
MTDIIVRRASPGMQFSGNRSLKASDNFSLDCSSPLATEYSYNKPGDARRAIMFVAVGDFFEFSNGFLEKAYYFLKEFLILYREFFLLSEKNFLHNI